jgi:hypothetical protein
MRGKTWLARMTRAPTCEKSRSVVEMHAASFELRKQSLLVLLQSSQHELPYRAMLDYGGAPMWRPQPILFFFLSMFSLLSLVSTLDPLQNNKVGYHLF